MRQDRVTWGNQSQNFINLYIVWISPFTRRPIVVQNWSRTKVSPDLSQSSFYSKSVLPYSMLLDLQEP